MALISTLDIARLWTRFKKGARVTDSGILYKVVEPVVAAKDNNVAAGIKRTTVFGAFRSVCQIAPCHVA